MIRLGKMGLEAEIFSELEAIIQIGCLVDEIDGFNSIEGIEPDSSFELKDERIIINTW